MRATAIAAAAIVAVSAYAFSRRQEAEPETGADDADTGNAADGILGEIGDMAGKITDSLTGWSYDKVPRKYRAAIMQAEQNNGIPENMLARLLWQESRYREDIITGAVRSPAGALGIAQFMPATAAELGIDPLNPYQAIAAAGIYLKRLYRATGAWDKALAAYNWGIGNVQRKGLASAPTETKNYFAQILTDLGLA